MKTGYIVGDRGPDPDAAPVAPTPTPTVAAPTPTCAYPPNVIGQVAGTAQINLSNAGFNNVTPTAT